MGRHHIIAETDTAGATLHEYIWLDDLPVAVFDKVNTGSPILYYVYSDHLGRPAIMMAQDGSWVWYPIYSPFGAVSYVATNAGFNGPSDIRFPGQWFQLESGLAYNWHRHYDATFGRHLQPDPLGFEALMRDGANPYSYVRQNPIARTDPSGLLSVNRPATPSTPVDTCARKKNSTALLRVSSLLNPPSPSPNLSPRAGRGAHRGLHRQPRS